MTIQSLTVTITTAPTRLNTADDDGQHGSSCVIYNPGPATVYLGDGAVATAGLSKGAPVPAGTWGPSFDNVQPGEILYGVVASGTQDVTVLEQGV